MSKIKSVSQFEDNVWSESTPIGADASNIDVEMSDSSIKDLQTVLGDIPSTAASIQSQLNNKVTASGGNIQSTVVTTGIQNYDNSSLSDETSTALLDANVRVVNAQDTAASMWTKFNRFRRRVDNKFKDIFLSSVEDVASPSLIQTYSQSALNNYFSNVIGYTSAADVASVGSVANQLSTLNNRSIVQATGATPDTALNLTSGVITQVPLTQTTINQDITNDVVLNTSVHTLGINTPGTYRLTGSIYTNVTSTRCGVYLRGDAFNVTAPNAEEIAVALVVGSVINVSKIITVTQGCYIWLCARVVGGTGTCYTGHNSTFLQIERLR